MTEPSDADRIAQDNASIELNDGKTYELHYGFGGLRKIESHFGSVKNLLEKLSEPMGDGYYEAAFFGILYGLWKSDITEEQLEELLEPGDDDRYGPPLITAITTSFPRQAQEMIRQRTDEATTKSPGRVATTSPQSASKGRNKPSGK